MKACDVYAGSDGELTKQYYRELESRGPIGVAAMNLFRAQKCSARAKVYRGGIRGKGSYRAMAYERKSWSMGLLCQALAKYGTQLAIVYGWKEDPTVPFDEGATANIFMRGSLFEFGVPTLLLIAFDTAMFVNLLSILFSWR
jgi:hypothetical protein